MDIYHVSAFELYFSLFHILLIKSSYRVDWTLFNFLFTSFEFLEFLIIGFGHKEMNTRKALAER